MVARGVRFVLLFLNSLPWDNHTNIKSALPGICRRTDKPAAALVTDLKRRGLLDSTLLVWNGEFGRLPISQFQTGKPAAGRDHNPYAFSVWMAGGGIKGGTVYGATDEFGMRAVENRAHVRDLHATILHLMGLDHEQLTFRHSGRDFRLTDVGGRVIHDIIA